MLGNGQTRTFIYDLFSVTEVRDQHLYVRPFRNTAKAINISPISNLGFKPGSSERRTGVLVKQLRSGYNRC